MKGKISTKAIVITILTVVLLAVATTGTVLFLKDNGEAAAATGESNNNTEVFDSYRALFQEGRFKNIPNSKKKTLKK